ncbi:MAG TPA: HAMP domain-containing sensor histidine kinase [Kofleriaceae bacterium]|nr:HAMP domain-containing sensor histidine kinase [Kofleriaceae bacterium]
MRLFFWFGIAIIASAGIGAAVAGDGHGLGTVPLLVMSAAILWGVSGVIAWRLTRPLTKLVHVARAIGDGHLDARLDLGPKRRGELGVLAEAVNDMAARIEAQLGAERALLAAVSHEIRTPLGHMRVLLDIARDNGTPETTVAELEREVLEIDALADQLLASSRLDFDALDWDPVDLGELCARALDRAGQDPTCLVTDGDVTAAAADRNLLLRALANILRNASEHGGGVRCVRVTGAGEDVTVAIDDGGPGFADGDLERAFEPFFRGQQRAGAGSLGLGLALVRRIARAHGGDARAENLATGGARVTLSIPRAGDG